MKGEPEMSESRVVAGDPGSRVQAALDHGPSLGHGCRLSPGCGSDRRTGQESRTQTLRSHQRCVCGGSARPREGREQRHPQRPLEGPTSTGSQGPLHLEPSGPRGGGLGRPRWACLVLEALGTPSCCLPPWPGFGRQDAAPTGSGSAECQSPPEPCTCGWGRRAAPWGP